MARKRIEAFRDKLVGWNVFYTLECGPFLLLVNGLLGTTQLYEVHLGHLHEFLFVLRVLLDESQTDDEVALFPQVLVVVSTDAHALSLPECVGYGDIEIFGAKHEPLVDVDQPGDYLVCYLVNIMLHVGRLYLFR